MTIRSPWVKLALILYLLLVHLLAFLFVMDQINGRKDRGAVITPMLPPTADSAAVSRIRPPDPVFVPDTPASPPTAYSDAGYDTGRLMIPVAGVRGKDLLDTYTQSRSGGRTHNAIDIMAPEGTPVVAVADGTIAKFFESKQGGTTIYQWSADKKRVYYYAHLQRRAEGISEGAAVRRGTVLGYVGNTGNAGPNNFHLHFSVMVPRSPDRHWDGEELNPYPLLKEGIEVPAAKK